MSHANLNRAEFVATFPAIKSALLRDGNGGGMQCKLEIPENQMGEAVKLFGMTEKRLRVVVEVVETNEVDKKQYGGKLKK